MKILLTNDDGYRAEGINILRNILEDRGHDVWICAPHEQRSSFSHSISFRRNKVYVYQHDEKVYSCSGTPADTIIYGLGSGLFGTDFDLVVSGINNGYNRSSDLVYSGTAGAAREACFSGYRAIAVSAQWVGPECPRPPFEKAALFLADNLERLMSYTGENLFININVPDKGSVEDWGLAKADSVIHYRRSMNAIYDDEEGGYLCSVFDDNISHTERSEDSDFALTENGIISVSVVDALPGVRMDLHEKIGKEWRKR